MGVGVEKIANFAVHHSINGSIMSTFGKEMKALHLIPSARLRSLTPSHNNGFLNMLKLMQMKELHLYMEEESVRNSKDFHPNDLDVNGVHVVEEAEKEPSFVGVEGKDNDFDGTTVNSRVDIIRQKLETKLEPMVLELEDISHQHAGHALMQDQTKETHFNVKIISAKFEGVS
ncbi:hypothetical protein KI387_031957 [Taxus chinensis]|uniref:Uncharacterized protein n=1 Tax=Taxus chinensis TaxID=29808 RepID=A0AA38BN33_TAXCH|nr:hypothetical protein KI387_031957 [Taxus chinensis]